MGGEVLGKRENKKEEEAKKRLEKFSFIVKRKEREGGNFIFGPTTQCGQHAVSNL